MSKPLPSIEGGIATTRNRGLRTVTAYGNYDLPRTFPEDSPYRKYQARRSGRSCGCIWPGYPPHPAQGSMSGTRPGMPRSVARMTAAGIARAYRAKCPDIYRVYANNPTFIDEKKAGMSRSAAVKAQAEGVSVANARGRSCNLPGLQEAAVAPTCRCCRGRLAPGDQVN